MDHEPAPHVAGLRAIACGLSTACALLVARAQGLRPLDVALWTVLVPLAVGALAVLLPHAVRRGSRTGRRHTSVIVAEGGSAAPDPAVQSREGAVEQARLLLIAARHRGAPLEELLVLAQALHEASLEHARATAAAGGHVPQALRDELALRERPAGAAGAGLLAGSYG
jgi:hypothetical protein